MLAAESVPVRKVSRPSASGRSSCSSVFTWPSGCSSAISMRIPLAPTSMTDMIGGAPPGAPAAAGAAVGAATAAPATPVSTVASVTAGYHRLEPKLALEEVPFVPHRPLVQGHVAARAQLQPQRGAPLLCPHRCDLLAVVVVQRVGHAKDRRQHAYPLAVPIREVPIALVAQIGRGLPVIARDVRDDHQLIVGQSQDRCLGDDVERVTVVPV